MPNEREYIYQPLKVVDYDIAGNALRAYYDADDKLVLVIDLVINDIKPNVLLVMNPVGMRKWDDILMNDYGVDLETVRPKKDNKYQKLDVEYTGLAAYDALIQAYDADENLAAALVGVAEFRNAAARRSALERLGAADMTATRARETIEKTNETIAEQQVRVKELRGKLAAQRRDVGKEPTKQSAAKILRTESQIDAANDKLARSKKRLVSAQRRLAAAEDDMDVAQAILQALDATVIGGVPAAPAPTDVMTVEPAPVPMQNVPQFTEITPYEEQPKAEDMADEEVKPLFDKDPEIMDEEIAFKPIDFGATPSVPTEPVVAPVATDVYSEPTPAMPLSFQPPVMSDAADVAPVNAPVLDTLTPVSLPSEQIDSELLSTIEPAGLSQEPVMPDVPVVAPAPVMPVENVAPVVAPQPMPEIAPAPVGAEARPVSPIAGTLMSTVQPVPSEKRKPSAVYYVMLIILIVLSIFTLWLYQRSTNDALPELGAKTAPVAVDGAVVADDAADTNVAKDASPFIDADGVGGVASDEVAAADNTPDVDIAVAVDVEPEPVVVTPAVPIAQLTPDVEPEPIVVTPAPEVVDAAVVVPEPVATISPFLTAEPVAAVEPQPIVDVVVNKPAYNVSQNEKMFVAAPEYETDAPAEYYQPEPADTYVEEVAVADETVEETCADGNAPDADGCCAGEYLTDMGNGEYACCVDGTDECFPPMF